MRNQTLTRHLLGGIARGRPDQVLDGTDDAILRSVDVALSLGLLGLDLALALTLLAGRLPRLETGRIADRLLHLSDSALDVASRFAVDKSKVSVSDDTFRGEGW